MKKRTSHWQRLFAMITFLALASCSVSYADAPARMHNLTVTASAYNSVKSQTRGDPFIGAWGDRLRPGMKAIAVSRDLIRMGLKHNTRVRIAGLPGTYLVKDKMHKRWKRKIDLYMGTNVQAARRWGKRKVTIYW